MKIPPNISKIVSNLSIKKDMIGKSNDDVFIFENKYVLKVSKDKKALENEYNKSMWLYKNGLTSKPVLFETNKEKAFFLKELLVGKSLIENDILNDPLKLIDYAFEAIKLLRKLDDIECPFMSNDNHGLDFVHGDLCLPNIIVNNEKVVGFIDLENMGKGDKFYDYSWLLWSSRNW